MKLVKLPEANVDFVKGFKSLLPLDIQYFADGDGDGSTDDNPTNTDPTNDNPTDIDPKGDDSKGDDNKPNQFTQEDVNAIASKEAKKAQEKLLKQLGVTDFNSAKDGLAKFKEWQESQKSDAEKLQDNYRNAQAELEKAQSELATTNAKLSAITQGINPDSVDDVIVLAKAMVNDDTTIDEAILKVAEKYPHFKVQAQKQKEEEKEEKPKPHFTTGEHGKGGKETEADKWINAFKF